MKPAAGEWYIGIDAGSRWTQISCYHGNLTEPETRSTVAGTELYRIPTAICKRRISGKWCFGEEASRMAETGEGIYVDDLLNRALKKETILLDKEYQAEDLLLVFFRKVLRIALPAKGVEAVTRCVFSIKEVTDELVALLKHMGRELGLTGQQLVVQDHRESFYAYAVCQEPELWQYDVVLFSCSGAEIWMKHLVCNKKTRPEIAEVEEVCLGRLPEDVREWDITFAHMVQNAMSGRIVSSVYLIGSGFEGNWMKESLQVICRGKRAFQGKNLYTKGACYAGMLEVHQEEADTVYFCEYKIQEHIFLKVTRGDDTGFYPLLEAGCNRHQIEKKLRILLEGEGTLDLWMQKPGSREAKIESLELPELLSSDMERYRLSLSLYSGEEGKILLNIRDMGWGELLPGTGREWEYEIGECYEQSLVM